jgi:hypothetical protein
MIAKTTVPLALAALAALTLAGCGKQGELDRPRPLVGHGVEPNAQTLTRQQAEARARREADAHSDGQAPQSVEEVRNEGAQLPPPPLNGSTIPGAASQPNAQPPPGGLPNPMQPSTIPR